MELMPSLEVEPSTTTRYILQFEYTLHWANCRAKFTKSDPDASEYIQKNAKAINKRGQGYR